MMGRKEAEAALFKSIVTAILALGLMTTAGAAQDLGPAAGTKAPDIGALVDQAGKPRTFESLVGDKGVVLFFFRSTVW